MKIIIIGGGPCGLGAAWRLNELGYENWQLYEKNDHWGGLSASFQDKEGFWWDIGGHVLFSHYCYFDRVMDTLLGPTEGWLFHNRESWIWMQDRFVPYPLQNNIHRLPAEVYWECLEGIIDIQTGQHPTRPADFEQWIFRTFGKGLAKWFMIPYNYKVWAYPPSQMDWAWVGERVAPVDLKAILRNAVFQKDTNTGWGPNASFRFPRFGATGGIWRTLAQRLPQDRLFLNKEIIRMDTQKREIHFADQTTESYDLLLNTIPITHLLERMNPDNPILCPDLKYSGTHLVGLGLKGNPPEHLATKCWMYFPENNCPFYRVTVFSNYSPHNVPDIRTCWSLMLEVSHSPAKPVDPEQVVEDVICGALNTKLIADRRQIHHSWHHFTDKGYPTPSLGRNPALFPPLLNLEEKGIYSRGRFGAWRYEVGNMDHSFMQGVEWVNRMLGAGEELTLWYPHIVNGDHPSGKKR